MHQNFALLVQFTDQIVETWLVNDADKVDDLKVVSLPKEMDKVLMIRGNNDSIFFLETHRKSERIVQVDGNSEIDLELNIKIVYEIYGPDTVAIAPDVLNFEDDRHKQVKQSFMLLDISGKLSKISNPEGTFQEVETFQLEHHSNIIENIRKLCKTDWLQFHADNRSVTIGNTTYGFKS